MIRRSLAATTMLLTLAGCGGSAQVSSVAPSTSTAATGPASAGLQQVEDAARKEGQLTLIWTSGGLANAQTIDAIAAGAKQAYGVDFKVDASVTGPSMPDMSARVIQEFQTHRAASTDVFFGEETTTLAAIEAGALTPVDWASWSNNVKDSRLTAPDGVAVEMASRTMGILYNTKDLTGDRVPKTLADLLRPDLKSKVATTSYAAGFNLLATPELWGEQKTNDYLTKLSDQVSGLIRCGDIDRIASGEFDAFAIACDTSVAQTMQAQGKPVGSVVPTDAPIVDFYYLSIPKNAAHPNLAKLWIDYIMSRAGQDILFKAGYVDHYLVPGSHTAAALQSLKVTNVDVQFMQRNDPKKLAAIANAQIKLLSKK